MKKIIIFGDLPIATKVVQFLENISQVDIIGVVTSKKTFKNNDPWRNVECLEDYCKKKDINVYNLDDLEMIFKKGELDFGLTCRFSKILSNKVIKLFKNGVINLHGGLLPEFGGLYSVNHVFISQSKIAGGTIHFIDEGIDTGNIIKRCEFQVEDNDTAFTIFQKTQEILYKNLVIILEKIINNEKIESLPINEYIKKGYPNRYFNKKSLEGKKEITLEKLKTNEAINIIKAFDFPGYEPAYILVNNKKIYLRTSI